MTPKQRYLYGIQKLPYCKLCKGQHIGVIGNATHTLGGCPNKRLRSQHTKRHDEAVYKIVSALQKGYKGATKILYDQGSMGVSRRTDDEDVDPENEEEINSDDEEEIDQGEIPSSRQTLPQCLYPTPINKKTIKRPDIVMIMNLRAQTILTNRFRPPKAGSNKIHIIEVSYTNLASYQ
jgi:hypothetical protein